MTTTTDTRHSDTCRCPMHAAMQLRRDACYRQLALAILGPDAPEDTAQLVEALAAHAQKIRPRQRSLPLAA
jgi:hypothetical protein